MTPQHHAKKRVKTLVITVATALTMSIMFSSKLQAETNKIVAFSDIKWEPLNPARGDKSPQAGALWGKRTGAGPAGFILKPVDGFASPPHIHNVAYRGVVIDGTIHNDSPALDINNKQEALFMTAGSFWTQPAGHIHITAARGTNNLAYIEIEDAFGVLPAKKAFDSGEIALNVDAKNLVWLDASSSSWVTKSKSLSKQAAISYLWGNPHDDQPNGTLVKLPSAFSGTLNYRPDTDPKVKSALRAVLIQGKLETQKKPSQVLPAGSYFGADNIAEKYQQSVSCKSQEECLIYVRSQGRFSISS